MIFKRHITALLIAFPVLLMASSGNEKLWKSAYDLYKKGSYKEAADQYDSLVRSGYRSAALYFNLGNSNFK